MAPSELLDLFIDGELDSAQEAQLFNALANDTELRSEFGNLMAIRSNIHRDFDAFAPSAAATGAVFSALNFALPAGAGARHPATGSGFWKKFRSNSLSALCAGVIVYLLMAGPFGARIRMPDIVVATGSPAYNRGAEAVAAQYPAPSSAAGQIVASGQQQQQATAKPDQAHSQNVASQAGNSNTYRPLPGHIARQSARAVAQPRHPPEEFAPVSPADQFNPGNVARTAQYTTLRAPAEQLLTPEATAPERQRRNPGGDPVQLPQRQAATTAGKDGYAVHARGISAWSFPNVTAATNAGQLPVNIAVGAYKNVSHDDAFGIEAGRESFTQRFTGTGANVELNSIGLTNPVGGGGRSTLFDQSASQSQTVYEQNPTVNWAAFGYRHTFGTVGQFQPYAHALVGGTELGPLGRLIVGTEFLAGGMVRLTGGIEGSMMMYNVQGHWFASQKIGFTYGISLLF